MLRPEHQGQPCPSPVTLLRLGVTSLPHAAHRHRHASLAPGYGTSGSNPAERIVAAERSASRRRASPARRRPHGTQPPWPLLTLVYEGFPAVPHWVQRHAHGSSDPGNGAVGSRPAVRISATTASRSTRLPLQYAHPPRPRLTLFSIGRTSRWHMAQRHSHCTMQPGYGTRGSKPDRRITFSATRGSSLALMYQWYPTSGKNARRVPRRIVIPGGRSDLNLQVRPS